MYNLIQIGDIFKKGLALQTYLIVYKLNNNNQTVMAYQFEAKKYIGTVCYDMKTLYKSYFHTNIFEL